MLFLDPKLISFSVHTCSLDIRGAYLRMALRLGGSARVRLCVRSFPLDKTRSPKMYTLADSSAAVQVNRQFNGIMEKNVCNEHVTVIVFELKSNLCARMRQTQICFQLIMLRLDI